MIDSPCVRNCCLDDDDVCLGCFRSILEIMKWGEADEAERKCILDLAENRRRARMRTFEKPA